MMRIITGKARGTRLFTLPGDATRPTSEKVKEAVFSVIQFDIEGRRILDLFAGSGQLALEALSRGALNAVAVDSSRDAVSVIRKNAEKTRLSDSLKIITADYKTAVKQLSGKNKFDIVFIDPPYAAKLAGDAVRRVCEAGLLSESAVIIAESDEDKNYENETVSLYRSYRYGKTFISVYKKISEPGI